MVYTQDPGIHPRPLLNTTYALEDRIPNATIPFAAGESGEGRPTMANEGALDISVGLGTPCSPAMVEIPVHVHLLCQTSIFHYLRLLSDDVWGFQTEKGSNVPS